MAARAIESSGGESATAVRLVDRALEGRHLGQKLRSIFAYRELIRNLVAKDLKLKYRGSVLGFFWSLINPLAMVAVYTLAFTYILQVQQPGFPFFILLGLLAWTFFSNAALMATSSLVEGGALMKAVRFPRAVLPLATVLFNLVQYLLTAAVLLPVMFVAHRMPPPTAIVIFPAVVILQLAFTVGVALLLATATTFFRDVRHFVEIGLSMLFWTTPIVYPLSQVPDPMRRVLIFSPMSGFVLAYQAIFYRGAAPAAAEWASPACWGLGMLAVGIFWFLSLEEGIGDRV